MGNQSRLHQRRTTGLHLETFERRNLLSGIHHLLSPSLSAPELSAQLSIQTNEDSPIVLTTVHQAVARGQLTKETGLLNPSTGSTTGPNPKADVHARAAEDSAGSDRHNPGSKASFASDSKSTPTTVAQQVSALENPPVTAGVSVGLGGTGSVNPTINDAGTGSVNPALNDDASASEGGSVGLQTPSDTNAVTRNTVDLYFGGAVNNGQRGGGHAISSGPGAVEPEMARITLSAGDRSSFFGSDSKPTPTALAQELSPLENTPVTAGVSAGLGGTALARRASPFELSPTNHVIGENLTASGAERPQAEEQALVLCAGEVEDGLGNASARGAGLLGSPLPFDLDSLAREAQQFFEQIDHLSEDLASLLARMNLSRWAVAAVVTATAVAVIRRRLPQSQRGLALECCAGTAFACYPGLGESWSWEES